MGAGLLSLCAAAGGLLALPTHPLTEEEKRKLEEARSMCKPEYNRGYNEGYSQGYYQGYNSGHSQSQNSGTAQGYSQGYNHGYSQGQNSSPGAGSLFKTNK